MKRILFNLLATLVVAGVVFSCSKEPGDDKGEIPQSYKEIYEIVKGGGRLQTTEKEEKPAYLPTKKDTIAEGMFIVDQVSGTKVAAYKVKTRTKVSMVDNPREFVTLNPFADVLWPGALVQGKGLRDNGVPTIAPVSIKKRKKGSVYLAAVTGNPDMESWYIDTEMSGSRVTQAMNNLLSQHLGKTVESGSEADVEEVHSIEDVAIKLGVNFKLFGAKLKSTFGSDWNLEKNYMLVHLTQRYFTMACDNFGGVQDVFTEEMNELDLKAITGADNPLCYVSSVTYGRSLIVLYESEASSKELKAALNVSYSKQSTSGSTEINNILAKTSAKVIQIGGNPDDVVKLAFGTFEEIRETILNGESISSEKSVGAPISFKVVHVHDGSIAAISNTLDYTYETIAYEAKAPKNLITINFGGASIYADQVAGGKRKISNASYSEIKNLEIKIVSKENGAVIESTEIKLDKENSGRKGVSALYQIYNWQSVGVVNTDDIIVISYDATIYMQTYHGGTSRDTFSKTISQELIYDTDSKKWTPIKKPADEERGLTFHPFHSLGYSSKDMVGTSVDLVLYYSFRVDGLDYHRAGMLDKDYFSN